MITRPRAVVTVAFGSAVLLEQTLAALGPAELVVVVDNSSDAAVARVGGEAGAIYIDTGANLGFAAGVNRGLRQLAASGFDGDVLILNPDARVTPAAISALQDVFDDPAVAAVSPSLATPTGALERITWPFPSPAGMWCESLGIRRRARREGFVVGAVLLLRREAIADVGPFDERYFLYAEETDWQRRAVDRGWRCVHRSDVHAEHVGAATSSDPVRREALFHAGQETYVRRWFGPTGWLSYRLAVIVGAVVRAAVLPGRRRSAAARAMLYLRGPRASAELSARSTPLHIVHLIVTGNAAGTERYVVDVARRQAAAGHRVTVVGGDPRWMRPALRGSVSWQPGATMPRAARSLRAVGASDIVHAHLTAADLLAVAMRPGHGAAVLSTRHIATRRGSSVAARAASVFLQRGITQEISISEYVAGRVGLPSVVLTNGVPCDDRSPDPTSTTILLAQRLEPEKATDVALRGWQASGLARRGWTLMICGDGSERDSLRRLEVELDIAGVTWAGWVGDVRAAMLGSAALLAPAAGEPFGLTVAEAMSIGLPVIASAAGGHLETLGRSEDAMLFPPGDVDACGRLLARFAECAQVERSAYGEALRQIQRDFLDVEQHVVRLHELYRRCLAKV